MQPLVLLLALLGFGALARRLLRSMFVLLRRGAEAFLAREAAELRARRGDLTGLDEARGSLRAARRSRALAGLGAALWLALIGVPPLLGYAAEVYALCALLWLVPGTRGRAGWWRHPRRDLDRT